MRVDDILYHSRIQYVKMVVEALGHVRVTKGLTAFEDGAHNWSHCFFARAFADELDLRDRPEEQIMEATGIKTRIPIRFVWQSFDSMKGRTGITAESLKRLIHDVMNRNNSLAVQDLLNSVTFDEELECTTTCNAEW